jgi:hypothetical protein
MILIAEGLGILIPLILLGVYLLLRFLLHTFYSDHSIPGSFVLSVSLVTTSAVNFFLARYLGNHQNSRTFIDKETGREFTFKTSHSLFFIPLRYWTWIMLAGAIALFIWK